LTIPIGASEREPIASERALNALIAESTDKESTVVLGPDFESVAGSRNEGTSRSGPGAHSRPFRLTRSPNPLQRAAELAVKLARAR